MNDDLYSRYKKCNLVNCLSFIKSREKFAFLISGTRGDKYMVIINRLNGNIKCTCSDNTNRPNLWCKHIFHILYIKTKILTEIIDPIFKNDELYLTHEMLDKLSAKINKMT